MARSLTADVLTQIAAGVVRPIVFYEGEFIVSGSPSIGYLRLWSGHGTLVWDGKSWTGAGGMLDFSSITEASEVRAHSFAVTLSGLSSDVLEKALTACRQGLDGRAWIGCMDAAGVVIADPFEAFRGKLDKPDIVDEAETCQISVAYEGRLIDLDRSRERRYTDDDQRIDYPSDRGFQYQPALQDANIPWGPVPLQAMRDFTARLRGFRNRT